MAGLDSFHSKLKNWLRRTLSCCTDDEEEEWKPVIGKPFDFRREDVCIAGLSPAEQEGLRIRAVTDANRMFATLQPLSHAPWPLTGGPSPPRPARPSSASNSAAAASSTAPPARLDRVKAHTRALSNSLETAIASVTAPAGYSSLTTPTHSPLLGAGEAAAVPGKDCAGRGGVAGGANPYEMGQLLLRGTGGAGRGGFERRVDESVETTWAGCEEDGDGDSGKGMMGGGYGQAR